jgi:hypothetical protein
LARLTHAAATAGDTDRAQRLADEAETIIATISDPHQQGSALASSRTRLPPPAIWRAPSASPRPAKP